MIRADVGSRSTPSSNREIPLSRAGVKTHAHHVPVGNATCRSNDPVPVGDVVRRSNIHVPVGSAAAHRSNEGLEGRIRPVFLNNDPQKDRRSLASSFKRNPPSRPRRPVNVQPVFSPQVCQPAPLPHVQPGVSHVSRRNKSGFTHFVNGMGKVPFLGTIVGIIRIAISCLKLAGRPSPIDHYHAKEGLKRGFLELFPFIGGAVLAYKDRN